MKLSSNKKVIAVVGATGNQGGGLVKAILNDPTSSFEVRALTRDPSKDSAKALKQAGADVVAFDMDGDASSMAEALQGVYGLYVVTNFWEHFDYPREIAQVKTVIEAGELANVQHYVWSTLEDTRPFFDSLVEEQRPPKVKGSYVPFFDGKEEANQLFPESKTTFLYTSFYMENLYNYGLVKNGVFTTNLDDIELPVIAVDDIGNCAYKIFQKAAAEGAYLGEAVHLAGERITVGAMMKLASENFHQTFSYKPVTRDEYVALECPAGDLLANMFEYMRLNPKYVEALDPEEARKIYPRIAGVLEFFKTHEKEMLGIGPNQGEETLNEEKKVDE